MKHQKLIPKMEALRQKGLTYRAIGEKLGIDHKVVAYHLVPDQKQKAKLNAMVWKVKNNGTNSKENKELLKKYNEQKKRVQETRNERRKVSLELALELQKQVENNELEIIKDKQSILKKIRTLRKGKKSYRAIGKILGVSGQYIHQIARSV